MKTEHEEFEAVVVDSRPHNEIPQTLPEYNWLFLKGIALGAGITFSLGGIIQYFITKYNEILISHAVLRFFWFDVNVLLWAVIFIGLMFIAIRNIQRLNVKRNRKSI